MYVCTYVKVGRYVCICRVVNMKHVLFICISVCMCMSVYVLMYICHLTLCLCMCMYTCIYVQTDLVCGI